MFADEKS